MGYLEPGRREVVYSFRTGERRKQKNPRTFARGFLLIIQDLATLRSLCLLQRLGLLQRPLLLLQTKGHIQDHCYLGLSLGVLSFGVTEQYHQ
jgi:hypothetical protein